MSALSIHEPIVLTDGGPWADHDMVCAICREKHAVLDLNTDIFLPCWNCQGKGWRTDKTRRWINRGKR